MLFSLKHLWLVDSKSFEIINKETQFRLRIDLKLYVSFENKKDKNYKSLFMHSLRLFLS